MFTFHAMGTDVTVGAPDLSDSDEESLAARVAGLFEEREQRFSRFRPDSELSRMLASRGPTSVSEQMFETLEAARRHFDATGGLFDPAIGATLAALGYDRSLDEGALDRDAWSPPPPASLRELRLVPSSRTVERPPHLAVDLGGLVKGRTVDEAARLLPSPGFVEAGGDAFLKGAGPDGRGWLVDVEDPSDPDGVLLTLRVSGRGVATSAPNRRRWRVGATIAHHLIDPRTQAPACSDLAQVTVVAASAEIAEVLAKVLFLLGRDAARATVPLLSEIGAVLVGLDGEVEIVGLPSSVVVGDAPRASRSEAEVCHA